MQLIKRIAEKVSALVTDSLHPDVERVVAALQLNNNTAVNDHTNKPQKVFYLAEYTDANGKVYCVPLYAFEDFCLNAIYVDSQGKAHISRLSVGGMVRAKDATLKNAIKTYAGSGIIGAIYAC